MEQIYLADAISFRDYIKKEYGKEYLPENH